MALATRRSYAGAAPACTLSSDIAAGATSFSITGTTTNWPTTATGPFYMVIDPGLSTEEKVLVGARTSGSLSSVTRGVDGTTAASHVTGATCYPVFTAVDANDANLLASRLSAKGDLISSDGSDPTKVAVGSNNTRLVADSAQTSGMKWVADTQNTVIDAKGDLLVGSANDTVARLAVGTDGHALVADSNAANGLNYSPLTGFRNVIINGNFEVWQRGTSFTGVTNTSYTADRMYTQHSGSSVNLTVTRDTSIPNPRSKYSIKFQQVTSNATSVTDYGFRQYIEGTNVEGLYGRTVTLSFWYMSNKTGSHGVRIYGAYATGGGDYISTFTVSAANTWEYKTITTATPFGSITANNVGATDPGAMVQIGFCASSNGFTSVSANDYFQVSQLQLEVGSVATPFEQRSFGIELALCQRYYERTYDYGTATGTASSVGQYGVGGPDGVASTYFWSIWPYKVEKRASPTVTLYDNNGNSGKITTWQSGAQTHNVTPGNGNWQNGTGNHKVLHQGSVAGFYYQAVSSAEL